MHHNDKSGSSITYKHQGIYAGIDLFTVLMALLVVSASMERFLHITMIKEQKQKM